MPPPTGAPATGSLTPEPYRTATYDYALPAELIAQIPPENRDGGRLLVLDAARPAGEAPVDRAILDLPQILLPGDLLILNDTRVRPARLHGVRAATGGQVEVLVLESGPDQVRILTGARGTLRAGETLVCAGGLLRFELIEGQGEGVFAARTGLPPEQLENLLAEHGRVPLPPYIDRDRAQDPRDAADRERYQTVFARRPGAAAAPTAGLHLTPALFRALEDAGITSATLTLHVGLGTFRPVAADDLRQHVMHEEAYDLPAATVDAIARCRERDGRVVAVGTTTLRVLESAGDAGGSLQAGPGRTSIFIHEPFRFRQADLLLTNFHAPRSTLLMLVAAFAGRERILAAYRHAVAARYRFLSYGDAMLIRRPPAVAALP